MPTERYCEGVQVREVRFSRNEITQLLIENFKVRADQEYDFDYNNPMVLYGTDGSIFIRFIQQQITQETQPQSRNIQFKPLPTPQQLFAVNKTLEQQRAQQNKAVEQEQRKLDV